MRVRLSSESAGSIAITPVVVQEMTAGELVGHILSSTGKDAPRLRELLRRGTLVSGASRLRWDGFDTDEPTLLALLDGFPNPDPTRAFAASRCTRVIFSGPSLQLALDRQALAARRFLHPRSLWSVIESLSAATPPAYLDYSYSESADRYRRDLTSAETLLVHASARLLRYSIPRRQLERHAVRTLTFSVSRSSTSP